MNIYEKYEEQKYEEILEEYYNQIFSYKYKKSNVDKYVKQICNTSIILVASYNLGLYIDCLKIIGNIRKNKAMEVIIQGREDWFYTMYFESLLFCLINKIFYKEFYLEDIEKEINKIVEKKIKTGDEYNENLLELYQSYLEGLNPYYTVKFLFPYEPLFDNYKFDLTPCFPFQSVEVKKVPRNNDNYTSFEFSIIGFVNTDSFWAGAEWNRREKKKNVKKCLPLTNMLLLYTSNAVHGRFVPTVSIEQICSIEICQYTGKGQKIKWTLGTDFGAQRVGGNIPVHKYSEEELLQINNWIISSYGSEHFVWTFQQAKNNMSAGLYVESFLLFCTCAEAMTYYWCRRIAKKVGKEELYIRFSKNKVSPCEECVYYCNSDASQKIIPYKGIEPAIFKHMEFLGKECNVDKKCVEELKKLIAKARNDTLRNDVVHGRTSEVSLETLKVCMDTIMGLQKVFVDIENQVSKV